MIQIDIDDRAAALTMLTGTSPRCPPWVDAPGFVLEHHEKNKAGLLLGRGADLGQLLTQRLQFGIERVQQDTVRHFVRHEVASLFIMELDLMSSHQPPIGPCVEGG